MDAGPKRTSSGEPVLVRSFKRPGLGLVFYPILQALDEGLAIFVLFFVGEDFFYFPF